MNNNHEPLISVIIAVYNPGKYLRPCLDSIVNQTYKNLEIILVDDGSTDDSLSICNEYAEKDQRVIVHHKENSGVSATRNQGIRMAHGDYFSFIDSDDYLDTDTYEYLINLINTHKVDIVTHEHFITYPGKEITHTSPDSAYGRFDRKQSMDVVIHYSPFAWNKLFPKKCIEDLWFNETICRGEDTLFTICAFDKADSVHFDKRPMYHYVQSEESAVRGHFRTSQLTAVNLLPIYDTFFSQKYPELYDYAMSSILNIILTLYFDIKCDKASFRKEEKKLIKTFKEWYPKINYSNITPKRRKALKFFKISPAVFSITKKAKKNIYDLLKKNR